MEPPSIAGLAPQPSGAFPAWCEYRRGESNILLVAPHGGRRAPVDPTSPPANLRVNDVYTPEITRVLAQRLAAAAIINVGMDRNRLDLNRVSQVRRRARWYLELLCREIAALMAQHGSAQVIFVHGWNVGQVKCDIGVGAVETASGVELPAGAGLTVSRWYLEHRLQALRAAAAAARIQVLLGARYPASHPNNLVQLFAPHDRADDVAVAQLASWAKAGQLDAWQLELGIPLRWPGEWRDRFVDTMAAVFAPRTTPAVALAHEARGGHANAVERPELAVTTAAALQFYDPITNIGVMSGVGPLGANATGGRLLLFLGGQRIALFTGDDSGSGDAQVTPLRWQRSERSLELEFDGPMLLLDDAAVYLDLEAALAQSRLVEARLRVEFEPDGGTQLLAEPQFGRAHAELCLGGRRTMDTGAFANVALLRGGGPRHAMIAADFGAYGSVLARGGESQASASVFRAGMARRIDDSRLVVAGETDPYTPSLLEWSGPDAPALRGQPLSRMAILRGIGQGRYIRVAFGIARFTWGDHDGHGMYEYAVPIGGTPLG
jgi:hypothetical protein